MNRLCGLPLQAPWGVKLKQHLHHQLHVNHIWACSCYVYEAMWRGLQIHFLTAIIKRRKIFFKQKIFVQAQKRLNKICRECEISSKLWADSDDDDCCGDWPVSLLQGPSLLQVLFLPIVWEMITFLLFLMIKNIGSDGGDCCVDRLVSSSVFYVSFPFGPSMEPTTNGPSFVNQKDDQISISESFLTERILTVMMVIWLNWW